MLGTRICRRSQGLLVDEGMTQRWEEDKMLSTENLDVYILVVVLV